jgi:hypothetical protein
MAKARMLHKKISISSQVNKLSLPAKLLFTWLIPHADDDGKLRGDVEYVKATAVPMIKWSEKKVKNYLEEIKNVGLIYFWEENNEWFIEFIKWNAHQSIQKDRYKPSELPSFKSDSVNSLDTNRIQEENSSLSQYNISESNEIESNKSEYQNEEYIADNNSSKSIKSIFDPNSFSPSTNAESQALEAWKKLEPGNKAAFYTTYLRRAKQGLPSHLFGQFASEIEQDPTVENKGAVFNSKADEYFKKKGGK